MNKLMTAILLVSLSGAAFAVDEAPKIVANPTLPPAIMEEIKAFQAKNPTADVLLPTLDIANFAISFSAFSKAINANIVKSKQNIVKIIKDRGYDPVVIQTIDYDYSLIEELEKNLSTLSKTNLDGLESVKTLPQSMPVNLSDLLSSITYIGGPNYTPVVPNTFPGKCHDYNTTAGAKSVVGAIEYVNRHWRLVVRDFQTGKETYYSFSPDVGYIGQGEDIAVISRTASQTGWLKTGPDNKDVVVCIGTPKP
ncbi:MAG: hypothetical protein KBD90_01940 [Alphaproteobacteria bacterium]|nr:hypothetical protein [Alphaproteobacteria bacterium]